MRSGAAKRRAYRRTDSILACANKGVCPPTRHSNDRVSPHRGDGNGRTLPHSHGDSNRNSGDCRRRSICLVYGHRAGDHTKQRVALAR